MPARKNWGMMHFHTLTSAADAVAYFRAVDYHFQGAEARAYTAGKGADRLGLPHVADPAHMEALLKNTHPFTGETLTNARRPDRDIGRDMTISPRQVGIAGEVPRRGPAHRRCREGVSHGTDRHHGA